MPLRVTLRSLAVAAREVHDHVAVAVEHLHAVRRGVGLDHLPAADREVQRDVLRPVGAGAERHPVQLRVDVHLGEGRPVLAAAPVHPGAAHLVGQPRPAALDRRIAGDRQRPFDVRPRLLRDGRVELQDDRRGDAHHLPIGQLEAAVDLTGRGDGGETGRQLRGGAVAAHHRSAPGVPRAVAQRLGDRVPGAVAVEHPGDHLAVRVGQPHPLQPAVGDLDAHPPDRRHVGVGVGGFVADPRRARCAVGAAGGLGAAPAPGQRPGCGDSQCQRGQGTPPVDGR